MKNRNTFEPYQHQKQAAREALVREYLAFLKQSRVQVRYVTDLAGLVANYIAQSQASPCSPTTMLRNTRYKSLLLNYMVASTSPGTQSLGARDIADPKSRALVAVSELEASNLRRDNERLKVHLASLMKGDPSDEDEARCRDARDASAVEELQNLRMSFVKTCQCLLRLIDHMKALVSIDTDRRRVVDLSRLTNNVIVDSIHAAPFVEWYLENRQILEKFEVQ